ncbi:MAG TPA: restriction endonuclease subunit S [Bacteroidales bacterium]|nr:restriction endonuclease subunit S [Bacteroidales bacterium]
MEQQKNIPEIRFPEFKENWNENFFVELFSFISTNSLSREQLNYEAGYVKNIHYGDIHTKFATLFDINKETVPFINEEISLTKIKNGNFCIEGDVLFADASEDLKDVGKSIEIIKLNNQKVLAGLHIIHSRPEKNIFSIGFLGFLMKSVFIRNQIQREAQGTKVLSISGVRLSGINVIYPNILEQQKIASFFTAIDQKISQLRRKKTLLEHYKKGVMQRIFSQEPNEGGSRTPLKNKQPREQIRFRDDNGKEFPMWEKKRLGDLVLFRNGKAHEQEISEDGKYIVVNSKFISTDGEVRKFSDHQICPLEFGEIVIVMSDIPNGKALAKCFYIDKDDSYTLNQRIGALKAKKCHARFLMYIINRNEYYLKFDSGVGQTNLKKDEVLGCPLYLPNSILEQSKIANFLSAIDTKINHTQTQIEKAELWKKGLLQKMFM